MRQIGARDETNRSEEYGATGTCGRHALLHDVPADVRDGCSIKMASSRTGESTRSKLSRGCGRLKCCLPGELPEPRQGAPGGARRLWQRRHGPSLRNPSGCGKPWRLEPAAAGIGTAAVHCAIESANLHMPSEMKPRLSQHLPGDPAVIGTEVAARARGGCAAASRVHRIRNGRRPGATSRPANWREAGTRPRVRRYRHARDANAGRRSCSAIAQDG